MINHVSFEFCCWCCIKADDYQEKLNIEERGYIMEINQTTSQKKLIICVVQFMQTISQHITCEIETDYDWSYYVPGIMLAKGILFVCKEYI